MTWPLFGGDNHLIQKELPTQIYKSSLRWLSNILQEMFKKIPLTPPNRKPNGETVCLHISVYSMDIKEWIENTYFNQIAIKLSMRSFPCLKQYDIHCGISKKLQRNTIVSIFIKRILCINFFWITFKLAVWINSEFYLSKFTCSAHLLKYFAMCLEKSC